MGGAGSGDRKATLIKSERFQMLQARWSHYRQSPADYVQDVILANRDDGSRLYPYQADILDIVAKHNWVALCGCNGMGKDTLTAWLIEWYLMTHEFSKIPCTSGVTRQLKEVLFSEIHKWVKGSTMAPLMKLMDMAVRVRGAEKEWFALGFASKEGTEGAEEGKAEGFHADNLLYVITEAKAVPDYVWRAVFKACTKDTNRIFAQSVPGIEDGEFYRIMCSHRENWKRIRFSGAIKIPDDEGNLCWQPTTPLVSQRSIEEKLQEGEESPIFQASVLANFIKQSEDSLIPLDWVRQAYERTIEISQKDEVSYGVDPARFGSDESVVFKRKGNAVIDFKAFHGMDTMKLADTVFMMWQADPGKIFVDVIGIGAGVVDKLKYDGANVVSINVSEKANMDYKYDRLRSELWGNMKSLLDPRNPDPICIPQDEKLISQLTTIKYKIDQNGRTVVESKESMARRGLSSPDRADALCLAFFGKKPQRAKKVFNPQNSKDPRSLYLIDSPYQKGQIGKSKIMRLPIYA